ncbi:MAG: hypothetical protein A4E53_03482 [Pelotomaculum sp. PtaB.Bin104]|nr:MAG: hypothetical protein A4E53_03482 [Pelotomaculum sp. PtaB.Bin104]
MSEWLNLFQKEYRMTRNSALITLAIFLIGGLWLVYLSYFNSIAVIIIPAAFLLVFLLFYPALYVLRSLAWEWKVSPHLWLHCPQPAWMLLSAKLANALMHMVVVMVITAALLLLGISVNPHPEQLSGINPSALLPFIIEVGFYAAVFTTAASIYIGTWATLISVAIAMTSKIFGRFRWLAGIVVFFIALFGFGQLQQTWVYDQVTRWGPINIGMQNLLLAPRIDISMGRFYTGEMLFYLLLTVAIFALSAWLIDHKVEV